MPETWITGNQLIHRYREEGILVNPTKVDMLQKDKTIDKGYINYYDYVNKNKDIKIIMIEEEKDLGLVNILVY